MTFGPKVPRRGLKSPFMKPKPVADEQALLTQIDAARILGLSKPSMYKIVRAGALKPVVIAGLARPRYRRSDVEQLARGREEPIR